MKIRVRAKSGGVLTVTDENGHPIEGLQEATLEGKIGEAPVVKLTIKAPEVVVDAEAEERKLKGRIAHAIDALKDRDQAK